ncbi:MAG TPA: hypothetical protein VFN88_03865 [Caulobacteraceae bacterium]|nr:hypothetical protein [Caulobacteraceae bacterium]
MSLAEAKPATTAVTAHFIDKGFHVFRDGVDKGAAARLLQTVKAERRFDGGLFLTEAEFDADPQYTGVNPKPGRNLIERYEDLLAFVEADEGIVSGLTELLGERYDLLNKKFVCGVPRRWVPEWVRKRIAGNPVNNLGAYIRPDFRDVTYFYGIDFHQDLIDYRDREADFVTLYVYLHPVGRQDAPLFLLDGSHVLGGVMFPHDLERTGHERWIYRDGFGRQAQVRQHLLIGDTGYAAMWHACTLHGTQPDAADHERISLRYLFAKTTNVRTGIDRVNETLKGPISLSATRQDLAPDGSAIIKRNVVNGA